MCQFNRMAIGSLVGYTHIIAGADLEVSRIN